MREWEKRTSGTSTLSPEPILFVLPSITDLEKQPPGKGTATACPAEPPAQPEEALARHGGFPAGAGGEPRQPRGRGPSPGPAARGAPRPRPHGGSRSRVPPSPSPAERRTFGSTFTLESLRAEPAGSSRTRSPRSSAAGGRLHRHTAVAAREHPALPRAQPRLRPRPPPRLYGQPRIASHRPRSEPGAGGQRGPRPQRRGPDGLPPPFPAPAKAWGQPALPGGGIPARGKPRSSAHLRGGGGG